LPLPVRHALGERHEVGLVLVAVDRAVPERALFAATVVVDNGHRQVATWRKEEKV